MSGVFTIFLLLSFVSFSISDDLDNPHQSNHGFPRPLILQYTEKRTASEDVYELDLRCSSWRLAAETNNLSPWKTVPAECAEYIKRYMIGRGYALDLEVVAAEASRYAKSVDMGTDGKDAWVFDVDETLISNLPYYVDHGYGSCQAACSHNLRMISSVVECNVCSLEVFDPVAFGKWVDEAAAPAMESSLRLYEEILSLGFKVFLLTGRSEKQRDVTVHNLMNVGYQNWHKLILRQSDDEGKMAVTYKSERRDEMVKEGYRIIGNSGDQWSDLLGRSISTRSFKLPNPMYYIP